MARQQNLWSKKPASHHPRCQCSLCNRRERAAAQIAHMREVALEKARNVQAAAVKLRKEQEAADALARLHSEVEDTARRARALEAARERCLLDPRTALFNDLRASGLSMPDAIAEVERQFPSVTSTETNDTTPGEQP